MSNTRQPGAAQIASEALDDAPDAIWVLEAKNGSNGGWRILYANAAFERVYGVPREQAVGAVLDAFLRSSSSTEDAARTLAGLQHMRPFRIVHARARDGDAPAWIEASAQPKSEGGRTRWFVVSRDVTQSVVMQRRSRHLARALDAAQEAIAVSIARDSQWFLEYVNRAFTEVLGYQAHELVGKPWRSLFAREAEIKQLEDYRIGLLTGQKIRGDVPFRRKDGSVVLFSVSATPFSGDGDSGEMWAVSTLHDVTDSRREERRLREQAALDPLTRLKNRREFERLLQAAIDMTGEGNRAHAVMFIDLDGFKQINDAYGHDAGDRVLIAVADTLRRTLLPSDDAARWGGDEFAAILYFCAPEQAVLRGKDLLAALAAAPECRGVGASIGIVRVEGGLSIGEIMRRADRLVYDAKAAGRNRVRAEA